MCLYFGAMNTLRAILLAALLALPGVVSAAAADPARIIVIGDIHGELAGFEELIHEIGLTDAAGAWTGGESWLVSLGDTLDRGPDGIAVLQTLMRLQEEAAQQGGRVELVLGNHEVMNLTGELEYVTPADIAAAGGAEARRALLSPEGEIGAWLLQRPVILTVGDTAFVHGGLPDPADFDPLRADGIETVRSYAAAWSQLADADLVPFDLSWSLRISAVGMLQELEDPLLSAARGAVAGLNGAPVFDIEGPLWNRRAAMCHPMLESARLDDALAAAGARRVVIGHTPTQSRQIESAYQGRLIMADTGMHAARYQGTPNALIIEGETLRAYDASSDHWYEPAIRPRRIGQRPGLLSDDQLEEFLGNAPIVQSEDLGVGVTRPQRVTLERDGVRLRALFKAVDTGEPNGSRNRRARQIANSDRYQYEIAAYRLDRALGLDLVPVAVPRVHQGREGVVQFWIEGAINELDRREQNVAVDSWCPVQDQYALMNAFDALIHNVDRTLQNVMYQRADWSLVLIDHSRGFRMDRSFPSAIRDSERRLPRELAARFRALTQADLETAMDGSISDDQIRAVLQRRDRILDQWEIF
jgi:Calcineurin-like phosphoesterase